MIACLIGWMANECSCMRGQHGRGARLILTQKLAHESRSAFRLNTNSRFGHDRFSERVQLYQIPINSSSTRSKFNTFIIQLIELSFRGHTYRMGGSGAWTRGNGASPATSTTRATTIQSDRTGECHPSRTRTGRAGTPMAATSFGGCARGCPDRHTASHLCRGRSAILRQIHTRLQNTVCSTRHATVWQQWQQKVK